jgi:hypothetical protein
MVGLGVLAGRATFDLFGFNVHCRVDDHCGCPRGGLGCGQFGGVHLALSSIFCCVQLVPWMRDLGADEISAYEMVPVSFMILEPLFWNFLVRWGALRLAGVRRRRADGAELVRMTAALRIGCK